MKKLITIFLLHLVASGVVAQNDCGKYYPFSEGAKFQITTYDKKDRVSGVIDYTVLDIKNVGSDKIGTVNAIISDDRGKEIVQTSYNVICGGNKIAIEGKSLMNPQIFQQFGNMEYTINGTDVEWPNTLAMGQTLKDANMDMKIDMGGIKMHMEMAMTERKVMGTETVTTPAGTFECFVITYIMDLKMGMKEQSTAKQWIAEKVGMVKSENYDKKGNVISTSLLTKFSN
ncbi:hypothetical protein QRD02_10160 [Aequorivita sp. SDUM287046]|uniref:DUF3108 domain-containing protein n=1 Tax=Aequorivita aurantiaca TaxID=3053356 RepID=A0ABT8DNC5_9FLAO|nr:hypothetical protein [Aequorivita aurantiaca]MDN3724748.1 hypothetical protein [Aequorivita aurantiaca]